MDKERVLEIIHAYSYVITNPLMITNRRCAGEGFEMGHQGFLPCASTGLLVSNYTLIIAYMF